MGNLWRSCAKVREVNQGIGVLDEGQRRARGSRGFCRGGLFPIFTNTFPIRSPTKKCFRFVCKKLMIFVRRINHWKALFVDFFDDIFSFKIEVVVYEKLAKI